MRMYVILLNINTSEVSTSTMVDVDDVSGRFIYGDMLHVIDLYLLERDGVQSLNVGYGVVLLYSSSRNKLDRWIHESMYFKLYKTVNV